MAGLLVALTRFGIATDRLRSGALLSWSQAFSGSAQIIVDFGAGSVQAKFGGLLADTFPTVSSLDRATGSYTANGGSFSPYAAASYSLAGAFYGTPQSGQAPPETAGRITGTIGPTTPAQTAAAFTGSLTG